MKQIIKKLISSVLVVSLLAGIMIVSTAAPATPVDAGNLIKASNFYAGNDAWSISPNCKVDGVTYHETYVEEEVPTIGKTRALQITQRPGDTHENSAVVYQYVRLEKGCTYKISYWLKIEGDGSEFTAYYNPVEQGAKRWLFESGVTTTDGVWKKFEYTFNVDYDTTVPEQEFIRFEMTDTKGDSNVVFNLTDVQLEKTTKNHAPYYKNWSAVTNGNTVETSNYAVQVVTSSTATNNPNVSLLHSLEAGVTYNISFHLEIEGDLTSTSQTHSGYNFSMYEVYASPNGFKGIASTDATQDFEYEYTMGTVASDKTPTLRMFFARPITAGETITYTLTNFAITKKDDIVEDTEKITELVTTQPDAVTTSGPVESPNLYTNGSFILKDGVATQNFAMKTGFANQQLYWGAGDANVQKYAQWEVVTTPEHGNALKVTCTADGASSQGSWLMHNINWAAGTTYTISYWMKHDGTAPNSFYPYVSSALKPGKTISSDWQQCNFEFTPTTDDVGKTFRFMYNLTQVGQTIYLADVQVKQATPDQPDAGVIDVTHNGAVNTEYTISFKVDIDGEAETYTDWNDGAFFSETNRGVLYQTGFAGDAILATFDATAEGETFSYTYTPSEVDATAETSAFSLYLAPTTGGELTYTISDFSITYRDETVIKEIVVNGADITSANPGDVTDTWGTNANELAYTMIQRWERVNKGIFATTDTDINTALTLGNFTEFESGADYRYSLVVTPNEGYYFSKDISLKLGETDVEAAYYYCADGSLIIYPTDSEVFFTVLGDANKDGSADVRDLVRMKKKQASPSDTSIIVYLKKCKFETTTPNSILDADIAGLRTLLVNP